MYTNIAAYCKTHHVNLVAVSKTKPISAIQELYAAGQRIFGENRVQEMTEKYNQLPKDIKWHLIGHLQKNKVKYIAPFVSMIHSIDSFELLEIVDLQAKINHRIIQVLLQFHIATEKTKFGFTSGWKSSILIMLAALPVNILSRIRQVKRALNTILPMHRNRPA